MTTPAPRKPSRPTVVVATGTQVMLAIGVALIAALTAFAVFRLRFGTGGSVLAILGAVLIAAGVAIPSRATVGAGTITLGASALVAAAGRPAGEALMIVAVVTVVCAVVLLGADLSFVTLRSSAMQPLAIESFVAATVGATLVGTTGVFVLVAAVAAINWPGWLLVLPAVVLPVGSIALVILVNRYQRTLNLASQAPPPTGAPRAAAPSTGHVPPPPRPSSTATRRAVPPPPPRRP